MDENQPHDEKVNAPRGFARLTPEQRRALASKGGRTAHARGTASKFTPDDASRAGKIPHQRGTAHSWTSETGREAGRKGGNAARGARRSSAASEPNREAATEGVHDESTPDRLRREALPNG